MSAINQEITFNDNIEQQISNYDVALKNEGTLLGQSTYPLNKSATKNVSIGISPAVGFIPIVKLWGAHSCVFFTEEEWLQLMNINIINLQSPINIGDINITKKEYKNLMTIWIEQRKFSVIISEETFMNLMCLKKIITHKLNDLKALNFHSYYNLIILACINDSNSDYLYKNVLKFININKHTQNAYLMLECLHIYFNKICTDFEVMKLNK